MRLDQIAEIARARPDYDMQIEVLVALLYHFIVQPGECAVDGGASGGGHTLGLSKFVGPTGSVYSFEASPGNASWLAGYLPAQETGRNIRFFGQALGGSIGTVDFVVDSHNSGLSHVFRPGEFIPKTSTVVSVPMTTIDAVMAEASRVSFIKLDLEGMEVPAMRGAAELMSRERPIVAFENARNGSGEAFCAWFDAMDYEVYDFHTQRITAQNYTSADLSSEAVCGPRGSAALAKARWLLNAFWETSANRRVLNSWAECGATWLDPVDYALGNAVKIA